MAPISMRLAALFGALLLWAAPAPLYAQSDAWSRSEAAFGDWLTGNGKAVVRITRCGAAELCGAIVWLRNEALAGRSVTNAQGLPLMGASILEGFQQAGAE